VSATLDLGGGVEWVHECFAEQQGHVHVSVYLVRAPEGTILIDSGSFYHRESLARRIGEATGGRGPQALVLSHSDYPHSANIPTFRDAWGDFEIVASVASPEIQGLPYARRARIGESLEVLGRRFTFIDPPLADRSHTTWIYDEEARALFVADGFGTLHQPGPCDVWWGDLPRSGRAEGVKEFHDQTLRWLIYVDPDRLMSSLREMFRKYPADVVAPIHGPPIAAADLDDYLNDLEAGVRLIASEGLVTRRPAPEGG
jgi:glyoxylase-like metal-dependent hydrolase (beta-lactamase superfamily II)